MENVSESTCEARMKSHDERFDRDLDRIKKLEDSYDEMIKMSLKMGQLIEWHEKSIKENKDELEKYKEKLASLEDKPNARWEKFVSSIISTLGAVVGSAIIVLLMIGIYLSK